MQILIPDICVTNTYIHDLAFALEELGHQIIWNSDNLFYSELIPDVILSQWAGGYLHNFSRLQGKKGIDFHQLETLERKLKQIAQKTLIVAFVHNIKQRTSQNQESNKKQEKLFQINYESAHAFVHLGKQSIAEFGNYYPKYVYQDKPLLTISHGLNERLKISVSPINKKFLPSESFRIFVPGAIRYWSELTFLLRGFLEAKIPQKKLIIAGGGDILEGRKPPKPLRRILIRSIPGVSLFASRLDDETLCHEIITADLLIAPRLWATNSGIPYLAATFGKRCLGPNVGNVPEALKELNGILFEPENPSSLARAMEKAYSDRNTFSLPDPPCPSWHEIAKQIEAFIISLKN
jgi:glycosyltransferase involved in cell wall biosynthesis